MVGRGLRLLFVAVALAACDTTVRPENGVIAEAARASFGPYLGRYDGQFEGRDAALNFGVQSGRASLSVSGPDGTEIDVLGPDCQSSIGEMVQTRFNKDGQIKFSVFDLDQGSCGERITGRSAEILFDRPTAATLRIERDFEVKQVCRRASGDDFNCRTFKVRSYLQGRFDR